MGSSNDAVPSQRMSCCTLVDVLPGEVQGTLVLLGRCERTGELIADYGSIRKVVAVPVR